MKFEIDKIISDKKNCEDLFIHYTKNKVIRENKNKLFEKHIKKSIKNLEFANFIFEEHEESIKEKLSGNSYFEWCITIYYYAIYHAALSLLEKSGYSSKSHIATICAITLFYYHRDNILDKEDIDFLIKKIHLEKDDINFVISSKSARERACYGTDDTFEKRIAQDMQKETAEFIGKIRGLLDT